MLWPSVAIVVLLTITSSAIPLHMLHSTSVKAGKFCSCKFDLKSGKEVRCYVDGVADFASNCFPACETDGIPKVDTKISPDEVKKVTPENKPQIEEPPLPACAQLAFGDIKKLAWGPLGCACAVSYPPNWNQPPPDESCLQTVENAASATTCEGVCINAFGLELSADHNQNPSYVTGLMPCKDLQDGATTLLKGNECEYCIAMVEKLQKANNFWEPPTLEGEPIQFKNKAEFESKVQSIAQSEKKADTNPSAYFRVDNVLLSAKDDINVRNMIFFGVETAYKCPACYRDYNAANSASCALEICYAMTQGNVICTAKMEEQSAIEVEATFSPEARAAYTDFCLAPLSGRSGVRPVTEKGDTCPKSGLGSFCDDGRCSKMSPEIHVQEFAKLCLESYMIPHPGVVSCKCVPCAGVGAMRKENCDDPNPLKARVWLEDTCSCGDVVCPNELQRAVAQTECLEKGKLFNSVTCECVAPPEPLPPIVCEYTPVPGDCDAPCKCGPGTRVTSFTTSHSSCPLKVSLTEECELEECTGCSCFAPLGEPDVMIDGVATARNTDGVYYDLKESKWALCPVHTHLYDAKKCSCSNDRCVVPGLADGEFEQHLMNSDIPGKFYNYFKEQNRLKGGLTEHEFDELYPYSMTTTAMHRSINYVREDCAAFALPVLKKRGNEYSEKRAFPEDYMKFAFSFSTREAGGWDCACLPPVEKEEVRCKEKPVEDGPCEKQGLCMRGVQKWKWLVEQEGAGCSSTPPPSTECHCEASPPEHCESGPAVTSDCVNNVQTVSYPVVSAGSPGCDISCNILVPAECPRSVTESCPSREEQPSTPPGSAPVVNCVGTVTYGACVRNPIQNAPFCGSSSGIKVSTLKITVPAGPGGAECPMPGNQFCTFAKCSTCNAIKSKEQECRSNPQCQFYAGSFCASKCKQHDGSKKNCEAAGCRFGNIGNGVMKCIPPKDKAV